VALNIDKKNAGLILWVAMEAFYDVLFEVSNEDRHKILLQLADEPMNVTRISKRLGFSLTETSRHLSRIGEVGLTRKDSDGLYHINNFGTVLLAQLKGVEFITTYRDYFTSHSLTGIPEGLLARIGELSDSYLVDNVMASFHKVERLIEKAEEYILEISDRFIMSTFTLLRDAYKREVKLRNIQKMEFLREPMYSEIDPEVVEEIKRFSPRLWEERYLDNLPFFLYMSEKEIAVIGFPTNSGKLDYFGFSSDDKKVHKWCHDLFQHFWELAEKNRLRE